MAIVAVSLTHLFPSFPLERILYEDGDLIVIDKPVNVSTHAPDAGRDDDAVSRLKLALAERDRLPVEQVYLGIHQRLDRDTSGALLFTRQKSANAAVAAEFERRHVKKTYLAGVVGWPKNLERGVLRHRLVPGRDGRMEIEPPAGTSGSARRPRHPKAQDAVTRYRVLRRLGSRALLELSPETGRTHQLRVQVAAAGGAIAGDRLYEGEPAVRLMLHAARLELGHPTSGALLEVDAPPPPELEQWLASSNPAAAGETIFDQRLPAAIDARWALGRSVETSAFRLVNAEGDGVEGIAIDIYGEHLVAHFFSEEALAKKDVILDALARLGAEGVYIKVHPKQANTLVDPRLLELAPSEPLRGAPAPDPLIIHESGLAFRVRLGDGLKTGIFLDQRENRRRVRDLSRNQRVLNLFAYTCGFTVAAAAGGARATVSVDSSRGALAWGAENLQENGLLSSAHVFVDEDALVWLKRASKRQERYDLIVLDPPSYATTKTSRFSAANDFPDLAARALAVLAPGGRMIACTNHRGISMSKFRRHMHEAGRLSGRAIVQVKDLPSPSDFPAPMGHETSAKSVLVTIE